VTLSRLIPFVAVAVVVAVVGAGLLSIGSPAKARAEALDARRVRDLADVASDLHDNYTDARKPVPKTLSLTQRDPVTERSYGFARISSLRYRLCATFALPTPASRNDETPSSFWRHPAGYHCYGLDVRERVRSTW
jgi:hypothetical protein